jgi:hypothetical protein
MNISDGCVTKRVPQARGPYRTFQYVRVQAARPRTVRATDTAITDPHHFFFFLNCERIMIATKFMNKTMTSRTNAVP